MSATLATFKVQFPEFANSGDPLLQAHLDAALLEIGPVWGALADQGQMYLAAHKLALSPYGQNAKMVAKDGTTTYQVHYQRLVGIVSSGYRVA